MGVGVHVRVRLLVLVRVVFVCNTGLIVHSTTPNHGMCRAAGPPPPRSIGSLASRLFPAAIAAAAGRPAGGSQMGRSTGPIPRPLALRRPPAPAGHTPPASPPPSSSASRRGTRRLPPLPPRKGPDGEPGSEPTSAGSSREPAARRRAAAAARRTRQRENRHDAGKEA